MVRKRVKMKYRALWTHRPMSAIEEEEDEEEIQRKDREESRLSSSRELGRALTPYENLMRPPSVLNARGYAPSPETSPGLFLTLKKVIDATVINIVGFEENFPSHMNPEVCKVMWNMCQIYGKTRMAIDLVERELLTAKKELVTAKRVFEEMSSSENALIDGISQTRCLREIAERGVAKWKKEYRRIRDEKINMKLKANLYQLHHDKMESTLSDCTRKNHNVRAFLTIWREKEKKQTTKSRSSRPIRLVTSEILVNSRHCTSPRKHCPKVTLSLPNAEQTEDEASPQRFPPGYLRRVSYSDKTIMQRCTTSVFMTPDLHLPIQDIQGVGASQSASLDSLEYRSHLAHFTGSAAVTPDIPLQVKRPIGQEVERVQDTPEGVRSDEGDPGYVIIPEFEDREAEETFQSPRKGPNPSPRTDETPRESLDGNSGPTDNKHVETDYGSESNGHVQCIQCLANSKNKLGMNTALQSDGEFNGVDYQVKNNKKDDDVVKNHPDIGETVRDSVSTYLSGSGGARDVSSISDTINCRGELTTDQKDLEANTLHSCQSLSQPKAFMIARGVSVKAAASETSKSQRQRNQKTPTRPATCTADFERPRSRQVQGRNWETTHTNKSRSGEATPEFTLKNPREVNVDVNGRPGETTTTPRSVSVMNEQVYLPPLPAVQNSTKHTASIPTCRDSRYLTRKSKASSLPSLKQEKRSKGSQKSGHRHNSEGLRAKVRTFTKQVLPTLSSTEAPNTKYHQVLLIRSCSSEKLGKTPFPRLTNRSATIMNH